MFYMPVIISENKVIKRSIVWNAIYLFLDSFVSILFLIVVSRHVGATYVGYMSYAIAVSSQCIILGNFSIRKYHSSDINYKYNFSQYRNVRIITSILMCFLAIFLGTRSFNIDKFYITLLFCFYKMLGVIEDLVDGELQRIGRLDVASFLNSLRILFFIFSFITLTYITNDIIISLLISDIISLCFLLFNILYINKNIKFSISSNTLSLNSLIKDVFPLFIIEFISNYLLNLSKYRIDILMDNTMQAYYGYLSAPVFISNLLSMIVYTPFIKQLAEDYLNIDNKKYKKTTAKYFIIILLLGLLVLIGGYIIGLRLIGYLYGIDLMKFMLEFIILLLGGLFFALFTYFNALFIIKRKQMVNLVIVSFVFVISYIIIDPLILNYHLLGACVSFAISQFLLVFCGAICYKIIK